MSKETISATDHVHALVDAGELSEAIADRLDDNGFETIADLLIADHEGLTDVPYVGDERAETILDAVDDVEPDPLVDAREAVLEVSLGERLSITFADRTGWANERPVIATEEPTEWRSATGENWNTRRLRIADTPTSDRRTEYELVLGAESVYVTDGPAGDERWRVESVVVVGRVQQSSYIQLQGEQRDTTPSRPEGDDTWRQYHKRGEA